MSDNDGKMPLPDLEAGGAPPMDVSTLDPESSDAPGHSAADLEAVFDVPVKVSAVLGRARMEVSDLLKLGPGTGPFDGGSGYPLLFRAVITGGEITDTSQTASVKIE